MNHDLTLDEVETLIQKAQILGVSSFEFKGLKVRFKTDPVRSPERKAAFQAQSQAPTQAPTDLKSEELIKPLSILDEMSEEEILFYATPYYDELQAKKEAHQNHLDEEKVKNS